MPARSPLAPSPSPEAECRCLCGSLLARRVEGGVELKCRRCKRKLLVPLSGEPSCGCALPGPLTPVRETG